MQGVVRLPLPFWCRGIVIRHLEVFNGTNFPNLSKVLFIYQIHQFHHYPQVFAASITYILSMGGPKFSDWNGDIMYFRDETEEAEGILVRVGIGCTGRPLHSVPGVAEGLLYQRHASRQRNCNGARFSYTSLHIDIDSVCIGSLGSVRSVCFRICINLGRVSVCHPLLHHQDTIITSSTILYIFQVVQLYQRHT